MCPNTVETVLSPHVSHRRAILAGDLIPSLCLPLVEVCYAGRRGKRGGVVLFQVGTGPCGEARYPSYQTPSNEELIDLPSVKEEAGLTEEQILERRRKAFWEYPGAGGAPVCDPFLRASWEMYCRAYGVDPDKYVFLHAGNCHALSPYSVCSSSHPGCVGHLCVPYLCLL
jgi:hypothetical protein